jgi:hypothetical protein
MSVDSGIEAQRLDETSREQAGTGDEHERDRNLPRDEHRSRRAPRDTRGA